ncbi:MAG: formylglycine-generating enzyme family protein [Candidatus Coatesbacteria bacterium]|nr:formylglycine-generating enzyme family protein [Candidatus Coatesbacteria bacterium]
MRRLAFLLAPIALLLVTMAFADLTITAYTDTNTYVSGDTIEVSLSAENSGEGMAVDVYVGLITTDWQIYTYGAGGWTPSLEPWIANIYVPGGFVLDRSAFWWIELPSALPPISVMGQYEFAAVLMLPGTATWVCNASLAPFQYDAGGSSSVSMVLIPAGSFLMGSPDNEQPNREENEGPQRTVNISAFEVSETEVTQQLWEDIMGWNHSYFTGSNLPIEGITWFDSVCFCNELSQMDGLTKCYEITNIKKLGNYTISADVTCNFTVNGYRLPTEAEWEYACRAGTTTKFNSGDSELDLEDYAWIGSNSGSETHGVRQKQPNAWGLYDMHGNVWEWCWDWFDENFYAGQPNPDSDPTGPASGTDRAVRGGSWANYTWNCRSAYRHHDSPGDHPFMGIRLARSAP